MASIWELPVIYLIENNMYAEKTPISATCRLADIADRAAAYGIPHVTVDGNDVLAVYEVVNEAVIRARNGHGPTMVEAKTYRWHGHYEGDPQSYKPKEEIEDWKRRDPIASYLKKLAAMGVFSDSEAAVIDGQIVQEIDHAVKFAQTSPYPAPEETLEDVFV